MTHLRHLFLALFLAALFVAPPPARADDFALPGLETDAAAYLATLQRRYPAGGTPAIRRTAEQQAAAAIAKRDWPAAVTALETRIAAGDPTTAQYESLATAQLRLTPPQPQKAMLAGWQAYSTANSGVPEIPGLS